MAYAPSDWLQLPSHTAVVGLAPALSLAAPVPSSNLALSGGLLYYACAKWMRHQALPVQGWRLRQLLHSRPPWTSGSVHIAVRDWSSRDCIGCTLELRSLPHSQHHRDPDSFPIAPTLNITSHKYHLKVGTVNVLDYVHETSKDGKHWYIDNKSLHIGYPLDLAQRVGEVGIASACRRQAFVRAALVVQARVVWQGTGRVDFGSWFRAVQEQVVAFHAGVRGLGFVLWTAALPWQIWRFKTFKHFTISPWKKSNNFGGKHGQTHPTCIFSQVDKAEARQGSQSNCPELQRHRCSCSAR